MSNRDSRRSEDSRLPPGWIETRDPHSGRPYYANSSTGETSWDPPEQWKSSTQDCRFHDHRRRHHTDHQYDLWEEDDREQRRTHTSSNSSSSSRHENERSYRGDESSYMQAVRELFDAERRKHVSNGGQVDGELEFSTVSPGMVADLIKIQEKVASISDGEPLDPMQMPPDSKPPRVEQARLEVRLATLQDQLKRLS